MKLSGSIFILLGLAFQVFGFFGNQWDPPIVLSLVSPSALRAMEGYEKLVRDGRFERGDVGFEDFERAWIAEIHAYPDPVYGPDIMAALGLSHLERRPSPTPFAALEQHPVDLVLAQGIVEDKTLIYVLSTARAVRGPYVLLVNGALVAIGIGLSVLGLARLFPGRATGNSSETERVSTQEVA